MTTVITVIVFVVGVLAAYFAGAKVGAKNGILYALTLVVQKGYMTVDQVEEMSREVTGK